MKIKDLKKSGKYADLEISAIESIPGFLEMREEDFSRVEMNGCEFFLYLQKDNAAWEHYDDYSAEEKENIKEEALNLYGYTENDLFLVFFNV